MTDEIKSFSQVLSEAPMAENADKARLVGTLLLSPEEFAAKHGALPAVVS